MPQSPTATPRDINRFSMPERHIGNKSGIDTGRAHSHAIYGVVGVRYFVLGRFNVLVDRWLKPGFCKPAEAGWGR